MYHSQQSGAPYSRGRPPTGQEGQHGRSQLMGYQLGQFPPPTQLPEELESALAIRGPRDENSHMGHLPHLAPQMRNNQGPSPRLDFSPPSVPLTSDNQPGHQRGLDWARYQPPSKLFAPPQHHKQQEQSHSNPPGGVMQVWSSSPALDPPSRPCGGDFQGQYTPESAGSILASFGLSNEDLELLSHYPDEQLTPDTLPFILRDIQLNKASGGGGRKTLSHPPQFHHNMPPPPSRSHSPQHHPSHGHSPDLPSMLSVTQTAGKVIDYGHASRAQEEGFKREPLPKDRLVHSELKDSSSLSQQKPESPPRRHHSRDSTPSSSDTKKCSNEDYRRRANIDAFKVERTVVRDPLLVAAVKLRPKDFDLHAHREDANSRPSSESRSKSSSTVLKGSGGPPVATKRQRGRRSGAPQSLPTPTMISDFRAEPPKVYPHTCSLCHELCEQAKDWVSHVNTVNHTASCRDLRNKYPDWRPYLPRRDSSPVRDGRPQWRPKGRSPSRSVSRSLSWSPSPSPPSKCGRKRSSHHPPCGHAPRSPSSTHTRRGSSSSSSCHRPQKRTSESSGISTGSSSRGGLKCSRGNSTKSVPGVERPPSSASSASSSASKAVSRARLKVTHLPSSSSSSSLGKGPGKPRTKVVSKGLKPTGTKALRSKNPAGQDHAVQAPPAKKKKKKKQAVTYQQQATNMASSRLVYLSGLPVDVSKQEVGRLVVAFGKISRILLKPCPAEEGGAGASAKAVVYMVRAEDAQKLTQCLSLSLRDQLISASSSSYKKTHVQQTIPVIIKGQVVCIPKTAAVAANTADPAAKNPEPNSVQKSPDEAGLVLILGLPEGGYTESDIINLALPFGTPSQVIIAMELGQALVSLPTVEKAEDMVKALTLTPVKINQAELKMSCLRTSVDLCTPVALYNVFKGPTDETKAPVSWGRLLVVSNVPSTLTGPTDVQKLVKRFGTVSQALVLNHNMIIFEMSTAAIALAVYKRFQKYPCIIQNNPLTFSRKVDPKMSSASGSVVAVQALLQSAAASAAPPGEKEEALPVVNGAGKEEQKEERKEEDVAKPAGEKREAAKDPPGGQVSDKVTEKDTEKITEISVQMEETEALISVSDPEPKLATCKPESNEEMETTVATTVETEKNMPVTQPATTGSPNQTDLPATKVTLDLPKSEQPKVDPDVPKVTPEILKALLEECRARSTKRAINPPGPERGNNSKKKEGGEEMKKEEGEKIKACEEELRKKEKEREELEKKKRGEEKRRREEEKRRREEEIRRREEEKRRREEEKSEREEKRREEEKREREKRRRVEEKRWREEERRRREEEKKREEDRRRSHREGSSGSRSSGRSEVSRKSSRSSTRRDTLTKLSTKDQKKENEEARDEAEEEFMSFNMEDFVTVDEVGDAVEEEVGGADHTQTTPLDTSTTPIIPDATPTPCPVTTLVTAATPISETSPALETTPLPPSPILTIPDLETTPLPPSPILTTPALETTPLPPSPILTTPVLEATPTPILEATPTPILEATPTPILEATLTPVMEATPTPVMEATPAPVLEATPAPVLEATPAPVLEATPAPVLEATPAPVQEATPVQEAILTSVLEAMPIDETTPILEATPTPVLEAEQQLVLSHSSLTGEEDEGGPGVTVGSEVKDHQEAPSILEEKEERKEEEQERWPAGRDCKRGKLQEEEEEEEEEGIKKRQKTEPLFPEDYTIPPFNPDRPVGLEFLVPKTGFFCKVCTRFYSGTQGAERNHCRSLNHYQNLQKFLLQRRMKDSSSETS